MPAKKQRVVQRGLPRAGEGERVVLGEGSRGSMRVSLGDETKSSSRDRARDGSAKELVFQDSLPSPTQSLSHAQTRNWASR